jgi:hypothetical protein
VINIIILVIKIVVITRNTKPITTTTTTITADLPTVTVIIITVTTTTTTTRAHVLVVLPSHHVLALHILALPTLLLLLGVKVIHVCCILLYVDACVCISVPVVHIIFSSSGTYLFISLGINKSQLRNCKGVVGVLLYICLWVYFVIKYFRDMMDLWSEKGMGWDLSVLLIEFHVELR